MFTFSENPGKTMVLFDGESIVTFIQEHLILRSVLVSDLKLRPGGPVELVTLMGSSFYGQNLVRCAIECRQESDHRVRVILTPTKVDCGLLDLVRETREYLIEYRPDQRRFRYTITARLDFLRDIRGDEGLSIPPNAQWGDDNYAVIEFDDPMLSGGVGPQVPMTQDWTGLHEPMLAADDFTTRWKKRYLSVVLPTALRGLRKITFNRVVNGHQQFFNRAEPRTTPHLPFLYAKEDGRFLLFTPLFDYPASHHICEWGYDVHWRAMLDRPAPDLLFRQGQQVELSFQFEEIERSEAPDGYLEAPPAEIEPEERAKADRPLYEEPVCLFTRSTLDCPDQYGWDPGERCAWNRSGGHASGTGALEIHNGSQAQETAWDFIHFGPSYGCNPIPPTSRFRVSAWVKADELDKIALSLRLDQYNGPAMYSSRVSVTSTGSGCEGARQDGEWRRLEFLSEPSGSYTLSGGFRFAYCGSGSAALSEFQVERL
jgi:hypothetical protein